MGSKNIALTGFMGTGKSTVGRLLAKRLKWKWVDVDRYIEKKEGRPIARIFEKEGEPYFRSLEKEAIRELSSKRGVVITTGGGAVMDGENMKTLKKNGWVVALWADPSTLYYRLRGSRNRPLLKAKDFLNEMKRLLELRRPHYEKSDLHVRTERRTPAQVADEIFRALERKLGS